MPDDIEQVTAQLTEVGAREDRRRWRACAFARIAAGPRRLQLQLHPRAQCSRRDAGGQVRRAHRAARREDFRPRRHRAAGARDGVARRHVSRGAADHLVRRRARVLRASILRRRLCRRIQARRIHLAARALETAGAQWDRDDGRAAQRPVGAAPRRVGRAVRAQRGAQAPRLPARSPDARSRRRRARTRTARAPALEPADRHAHRMRPRRLPMVERAVQRGTRRRADRLGNLAGRRDAARPRLDLFLFRSREAGSESIPAAARCSTPTKSSRRTPKPPASRSRFPKCDGSAPSRATASA